jgi:hypothetical protein
MTNYVGPSQTILGEQQRQLQQGISHLPDSSSAIKQMYGIIIDIDPANPLIKARTPEGRAIADGQWIPLNYSVDEIVERFGTIRKGMNVLVQYTGPSGSSASAFIVGNEGEQLASGTLLENKINKGMYALFYPGIG